MHQPIRTFLAVEISDAVRDRACDLVASLQGTPANVRWVSPRQMHLTLKFLDNVEAREIPRVCERVAAATRQFTEFDAEVVGAGAFPDIQRPRTVWIGFGAGKEQLIDLHDAVEQQLADLGFREEQRRYQPHITIGRVRRSPNGIPELGKELQRRQDFRCGTMSVAEVVVFASRLDRDGPAYEALGRAPLGRGQ